MKSFVRATNRHNPQAEVAVGSRVCRRNDNWWEGRFSGIHLLLDRCLSQGSTEYTYSVHKILVKCKQLRIRPHAQCEPVSQRDGLRFVPLQIDWRRQTYRRPPVWLSPTTLYVSTSHPDTAAPKMDSKTKAAGVRFEDVPAILSATDLKNEFARFTIEINIKQTVCECACVAQLRATRGVCTVQKVGKLYR